MNATLFSIIGIVVLIALLVGAILMRLLKHEQPLSTTVHMLGYTASVFLLIAILFHAPTWALLTLSILSILSYQVKER